MISTPHISTPRTSTIYLPPCWGGITLSVVEWWRFLIKIFCSLVFLLYTPCSSLTPGLCDSLFVRHPHQPGPGSHRVPLHAQSAVHPGWEWGELQQKFKLFFCPNKHYSFPFRAPLHQTRTVVNGPLQGTFYRS